MAAGGTNLEYTISIDVARAMRDVGALANALQNRLAVAAQQARAAIGNLERATVRGASDPGGSSRSSLPAPARASSALLAAGAGAVAARAAFASQIMPIARAAAPAAQGSVSVNTGSPAASATMAAQTIAREAREAFAPLRLAMSRLSLSGGSRPALPSGGSAGSGRVVDVEASVISSSTKAAGGMTQIWRRALATLQSSFASVKQGAAGIIAKIDVGGALRGLRSLVTGLRGVQEEERKTREEASKGGGLLGSMGSMVKGAMLPLATLAAGYLSLSFAAHQFKDAINTASQFEQVKVNFGVLLGSAAKAKDMLTQLTNYADTTPFEMKDVAPAARTLLAFGVAAKDVMKDVRMLGDVAAGTQQPLNDMAEMFGKMRAEGVAYSIDLREMSRRGIPIIGALAKQFGVAEDAIHKMAEEGKIRFPDMEKALTSLTKTGGLFAGMTTAIGATFGGKITTLADAWHALQREFATPILAPLKVGVTEITNLLAGWKTKAAEWGTTLGTVLSGVMKIIQNGDAGAALGAGLKLAFAEGVNVLYKGVTATVAALLTGIGQGVNVLFKGMASGAVWKTLGDGMAYVGAKLGSAITRALANALAEVPGMSKVALGLNTAANKANTDAYNAQEALKEDLKNSDVRSTLDAIGKAATDTKNAFAATFANTRGPMEQQVSDAKDDLAGIAERANNRGKAREVYYDNTGAEYGPDSAYGSPGSNALPPGFKPEFGYSFNRFAHFERSRFTRAMDAFRGANNITPMPEPESDPGEGTIGGRPSSLALGGGRPLSMPWRPPMIAPDLNARAEAFIASSGGRGSDPQLVQTNRLIGQVLGFLRDNKPARSPGGSSF